MDDEYKHCLRCGYVSRSGETELKCPLCGKKLSFGSPPSSEGTCDQNIEKEFNNNYHDDFQEGRKTGEYCDKNLEKYANGGSHYHGTQKESYNEEVSYSKAVSYNQKTTYNQPKDITEMPVKAQWVIVIILSIFFPILGPVLIIVGMNKAETANKDGKNKIKKMAKICLLITFLFLVLQGIFGFTFVNGIQF